MTEVLGPTPAMMPEAGDLMTEVRRVLEVSPEPLTLSKIRSHLPTTSRSVSLDDLAESLQRLVDANVFYKYSKYRSQQPRYWDRPMSVHVEQLLREALTEGPLAWSQLRRKLPNYVLRDEGKPVAELVLKDLVEQGKLFKHPVPGSRSGERYAVTPPDPKEPLRQELPELFTKLERDYGFSRAQLRGAALELLHEEEWASGEPEVPASPQPAAVEPAPEPAEPEERPVATQPPHFATTDEDSTTLQAAGDLP